MALNIGCFDALGCRVWNRAQAFKETLINSEFPRHMDVPPFSVAASQINNPAASSRGIVGAKRSSGTIFHASPGGVRHRDMPNNSFAQMASKDIAPLCSNEFEPT
jgi:hypothetical protein